MIYSMTGYGKSVTIFQDRKICVEIRSLNGKAMDLSTRIAPQFKGFEMEIRSLITAELERGKVDFALWVEQGEKADMPSLNQAVMQGYVEQMTEARKQDLRRRILEKVTSSHMRRMDIRFGENRKELTRKGFGVYLFDRTFPVDE